MKQTLALVLIVFGIVGCSSEVKIECEYGSSKQYIISGDERTLTIIYSDGTQRILQKEVIYRNGNIIFRDSINSIQYDPLKKDLRDLGKCKEF